MSSWSFILHLLPGCVCPSGLKLRISNQHILSTFRLQRFRCRNLKSVVCGIKVQMFAMLFNILKSTSKMHVYPRYPKWCDWAIIVALWGYRISTKPSSTGASHANVERLRLSSGTTVSIKCAPSVYTKSKLLYDGGDHASGMTVHEKAQLVSAS